MSRGPARIFRPTDQATVSLAVTAASARVALAAGATEYVVTNVGTDIVFVRFGDVTVTATVPNGATGGSMPVPAGAVMTLRPPVASPTNIAAIAATSTATLYISAGEGM